MLCRSGEKRKACGVTEFERYKHRRKRASRKEEYQFAFERLGAWESVALFISTLLCRFGIWDEVGDGRSRKGVDDDG